jgi:EmrB/QacA subfamily drug resistance transporter
VALLHGHHVHGRGPAPAAGPDAGPATDALPPGTAMVLVAMGLGVLVIANDFTALNVALPAIEADFDVDVGTSQWVINAYALTFGMAIVTGGRLADMFGRRRVFFIGAAIFATFSLLGGIAPNAGVLIAMRVAMGVGGALMWPAILGMTYAALPAAKAGLAGGLILGTAGLGNAVGPLIGGLLTDELSWRWIFFLNVPIAAFAVTVIYLRVHQPAEQTRERIDYPGITALSLGLFLLLLGFDQAADWGWGDSRVIAMFVVAAALVVTFGLIEPRMKERAVVPSDVIRNGEFRAACIAVLLFSAIFFVSVLYGPQFMEKILGYDALRAGFGMLPMLAVFAVTSFFAGRMYERVGAKVMISVGGACLALGPFLISLIQEDSGYGALVPGLAVIGLGAGFFYASVTTAAITALDPSRSSLAGGIIYMFQIAGGAIGIGLTTSVFTTSSENELSSDAAEAGIRLSEHQESVAHGLMVGTDASVEATRGLSPEAMERIEQAVRDSFVVGLQTGFRVVSGIAVLGFVVSVVFVGGRLHRGSRASS